MILVGIAIVFLLVAIFGVAVAKFVLQQPALDPAKVKRPAPELGWSRELPPDPLTWVWWQDLTWPGGRRTIEIHLENGTVWRTDSGGITWRSYPSGKDCWDGDTGKGNALKRVLGSCLQQIDWSTDEAKAKHAHSLKGWSATVDGKSYTLRLLNGSTWQFNVKSEGLGQNNELAWQRVSSPEGVVFEAMVKIYADLNKHLDWIRQEQVRVGSIASLQNKRGRAVNLCGGCHFSVVSIPGGICSGCRAAQGQP